MHCICGKHNVATRFCVQCLIFGWIFTFLLFFCHRRRICDVNTLHFTSIMLFVVWALRKKAIDLNVSFVFLSPNWCIYGAFIGLTSLQFNLFISINSNSIHFSRYVHFECWFSFSSILFWIKAKITRQVTHSLYWFKARQIQLRLLFLDVSMVLFTVFSYQKCSKSTPNTTITSLLHSKALSAQQQQEPKFN